MSLEWVQILIATLQDISFWTGFATIAVFSLGRFNEKQLDEEELDPPLPARYFTTRFRYWAGASLYVGAFISLYCALIIIGSIPEFQSTLKDIFGSFEFEIKNPVQSPELQPQSTNIEQNYSQAPVGSPAWAAMVLIVLLPTSRIFQKFDLFYRHWLGIFSDMPYKARELADEILNSLCHAVRFQGDFTSASNETLVKVFQELQKTRRQLMEQGGSRWEESYKNVFTKEQRELLNRTAQRFFLIATGIRDEPSFPQRLAEENISNIDVTGRFDSDTLKISSRRELILLARRYSRMIACAVLRVEKDEYAARATLRAQTSLKDLESTEFRFTVSQVVIGGAVVVATALSVGVASTSLLSEESEIELIFWLMWSLGASVASVVPLAFAAAVHLFIIDRQIEEQKRGRVFQKGMFLLFSMGGCFGLAYMVILVLFGIWSRFSQTPLEAGQFVSFAALAFPIACVCVLYNLLSFKKFFNNPYINTLTDIFLFFIAASVSIALGYLAIVIYDYGDIEFWNNPIILGSYLPYGFVITVAAGLFGSFQCTKSRQF